MKQNQFITAFKLSLSALALMFAVTSCEKKASDVQAVSDSQEVASAGKGKPGSTIQEVLLKVTVNDAAGDKLTSDPNVEGDYINGSQKVSAKFDQYGNFIFSCGLGGHGNNTYLIRYMNINFDSPVQVFIPPPITGNDKVLAITTGQVAGVNFTPIQNLTPGQSECIGLTGGSSSGWVMNFHRDTEDVPASPSAYMVVTRSSTNPDQWTMTPVGTCSPNSNVNVCALRNGPGTLYGYYNMPFSFTLTKLL